MCDDLVQTVKAKRKPGAMDKEMKRLKGPKKMPRMRSNTPIVFRRRN
jgi:hypothetical protein